MYADCYMISHGQTNVDNETLRQEQQKRYTPSEINKSTPWQSGIQNNSRFMAAELTPEAHKKNTTLKFQLNKKNIDVVLLPPSIPAIETYLDVFGQRDGIDVYIQPLLHPRINCAANIPPSNLNQLLEKFRKSPFTVKLEQNPNWFIDLGSSPWSPETSNGTPQQHCLDVIQKTGDFENEERFLQRTLKMRKELFEYVRTKKVVALITHPKVLEVLTATGWHEDGRLINSVHFQPGQLKREHVWIEGVTVEQEEKGLPFCSCG